MILSRYEIHTALFSFVIQIIRKNTFTLLVLSQIYLKMKVEDLKLAIKKFNPNNVGDSLPGRESHSEEIFQFLVERLKIRKTVSERKNRVASITKLHNNGIIFICGVPGTGKTVTVSLVVNKLENYYKRNPNVIHQFNTVFINGQRLSSPEKVYSEIYYKLTNKMCSPEKAQEALDKLFDRGQEFGASKECFQIIVIDELDLLYNEKRQDVLYSLFDWPTSSNSKVLLIAIANAFDMSERFMHSRVSSRMGWNKLVFEPYTSTRLETIIKVRLGQELMDKCFDKNAILIATKRIARSNGDARRILDTCRLALESAIEKSLPKVTSALIDQVGFQAKDINRRKYIDTCPPLHLLVLKAIIIESEKLGDGNINAYGVYKQLLYLMSKSGLSALVPVSDSDYAFILYDLAATGLIYLQENKPLMTKKLFFKEDCTMVDQIKKRSLKKAP